MTDKLTREEWTVPVEKLTTYKDELAALERLAKKITSHPVPKFMRVRAKSVTFEIIKVRDVEAREA